MSNSYIPYGPDPASPARYQASSKLSETRDGVTSNFWRDEVHVVDRRTRTFRGVGATFAIPGTAALAQPLWSIENTSGSTVVAAVKQLFVWSFAGAASATIFIPPSAYTFRTTSMPTGGTTFTEVSKDTADSGSSANVTVRQGASADGTGSAITAALVAPRLTQRPVSNWASMVGFAQPLPCNMLEGAIDNELVIRAGQAIVLHANANAAADNATTRRWFVDFAWEEFTEY